MDPLATTYRCHAIEYSGPKKLVLKSFLDTILEPRSVCPGQLGLVWKILVVWSGPEGPQIARSVGTLGC